MGAWEQEWQGSGTRDALAGLMVPDVGERGSVSEDVMPSVITRHETDVQLLGEQEISPFKA